MNLEINKWGCFKMSDIFLPFINGKGITEEEIKDNPGDLIAIQSSTENNACMGLISRDYCKDMQYKIVNQPCLTVARSGSSGFVSFQKFGCVIGDSAKALIARKKDINEYHYLFLRTVLMANMYKFTYGRKVKAKQYMELDILLPVDSDQKPDWDYMENYIKSLHYKKITTKNTYKSNVLLDTSTWTEFSLGELFKIEKGKRLTKEDMIEGTDNFLGAIDSNNGVRQKIMAERLWAPNCITINYNGSVGEAFYQSEPFWASDDVNVLYPKGWTLNKYIGLFIATVIKTERPKYNYGRKWTKSIMEKSIIKLPSQSGSPDWNYMEDYIKSLPYSDRI